jgi:hypothetical protein
MSTSVADVLAQLRELLGVIDQATVAALRVQTDSRHAQTAYQEVGTGTANTDINQAITLTRAAGDKAGKVAQLLAAAATAYADYINTIAPGTAPTRHSAPEAMPTGEQLVDEAEGRGSRFDDFLKKATKRADDVQDGTTETTGNLSKGVKAAVAGIRGDASPHGVASTSAPEHVSSPEPTEGTPVGEGLSALLVSAIAAAVAGKALKNYLTKRREEQ